jgi:hypothetical protein
MSLMECFAEPRAGGFFRSAHPHGHAAPAIEKFQAGFFSRYTIFFRPKPFTCYLDEDSMSLLEGNRARHSLRHDFANAAIAASRVGASPSIGGVLYPRLRSCFTNMCYCPAAF